MKTARKNFKQLLQTSEHFELDNDPFTEDAIEGWKNTSLSFDVSMASLDKKSKSHSRTLASLFSGFIILLVAVVLMLMNSNEKKMAKQETKPMMPINKQKGDTPFKTSLPPSFKMNKTLAKTKSAVLTNDIDSNANVEEMKNQAFVLDPLAPKTIINIPTNTKKRSFNAVETYLSAYRVVDYRYYRKKAHDEDGHISNGTPANLESGKSFDILQNDEQNWKKAYFSFLEKSLQLFKKGEYGMAGQRFDLILENFPDDLNATFYAALCMFELQQYERCEKYLTDLKKITFTNFDEEAEWLQLKCHKALHHIKEFEELKKEIILKNGFYKPLANQLN
jgi:TolA-binding protein